MIINCNIVIVILYMGCASVVGGELCKWILAMYRYAQDVIPTIKAVQDAYRAVENIEKWEAGQQSLVSSYNLTNNNRLSDKRNQCALFKDLVCKFDTWWRHC